jgi:hypothetical protein
MNDHKARNFLVFVSALILTLACSLGNQLSESEIQAQVDATMAALHGQDSSEIDFLAIPTFTRVPVEEASGLNLFPVDDNQSDATTSRNNVPPCPGSLSTRVQVGMTLRVTTNQTNPVPKLGIRPQPTLDSNKMFELKSGEQMQVLDGPVCANESYFWHVSTPKGDGWVREGNTEFYFVDPIGQSSTIPATQAPVDPPTPVPQVRVCPGALPTRVQVGMTLRVTTNQTSPVPKLGIRPQPTLDTNKMFELKSGEQMRVLDGPECANDSYFWYITSAKGDGWVREGNTEFYFVDPLP